MDKGGEPIRDTILFGKYQLIRTLGRGRSSTVYLAKHLELDEYRAVKCVAKTDTEYERFKREALILKRLRHPGIPIVYDIEEEEYQSYLIEEFLEGDSFYDLIKEQGHLNQSTVIRYGIQICDLVHYLHSAEQIPILYLDLQPRNLLVCHEQVKLIDFDHADFINQANQDSARYGTPGYAAPEQLGDYELGIYTDVYQIGALLAYLLTGQVQDRRGLSALSGELGRIIRTCSRDCQRERYQSVLEIRQELERLYARTNGFQSNQETSLICAFAGTRPGMGTTHLALGFCSWLKSQGLPVLYEERNHSNDIRKMAGFLGKEADSKGIYKVFGIPVKPMYGAAARLETPSYPVIIRDYGSDWKEQDLGFSEQLIFLASGGKWWQNGDAAKALTYLEMGRGGRHREKVVILYTHVVPMAVKREVQGVKTFLVPEFLNPFALNTEAASFYQTLWKLAEESWERCGNGLPGKKKRKIPEMIRRLLG